MRLARTGQTLQVLVNSEDETADLGRALAEVVRLGTVIGLVGPLGAGKTRLVRSITEALGVDPRAIGSPTFVLIHEYEGRLRIAHFDAYRLSGPDEFEALGPAEYWECGLCLVEWADRVAPCLPPMAWSISIEPTGPTERRIAIELPCSPEAMDALETRLSASSQT